jgi:glycosyltransferase involved in cell wall biosynthesis
MKLSSQPFISVTVPLFNESAGIRAFHTELLATISSTTKESYEIIYCDDGSTDTTSDIVRGFSKENPRVKLLQLSRNFGKESALSAAIHAASGQAIIMLDGDGQHPVALLPQFIIAWQQGAKVVIGLRSYNDSETLTKRFGSWLFYNLFNCLTSQKLIPGATDYRLIDRVVQQAFLKLPETDRITRGLIDWLGFKRTYLPITRVARTAGVPTYSLRKLMVLAANSFVSLSAVPLYIFGYLGILITSTAFIVGSSVFVEQILLRDPLNWRFTGSAMLGILILFLIGIVLISQGIISLYISHMHSQTKRRPLYVIDYEASSGLTHTKHA